MAFSLERHVPKLNALAAKGIYLGTSSWKYEGWVGQVYKGDYSSARSSLNKKRFEQECLAEFATVFPTTCLDEGYWRFPDSDRLAKYAAQVPHDFRFGIKVTNQITERRSRDGRTNDGYLNPQLYREHFHDPARVGFGDKLGPIIFEFSPFFFGRSYGQNDYSPLAFVKDLHNFLERIPKEGVPLAVEVRDPQLLEFPRYFDCLEYHGVAHVFNEQTWMPDISQQLDVPGIYTAPHTVVRALVRPGVKHNDAVEEFEPYDRTQIELPLMRQGISEIIKRALTNHGPFYAYVNNRSEGNAPNTIADILELLSIE